MRILALWVVNYYSGSTSERFVKPLESLGHTVEVIPLEDGNVEAKLIRASKSHLYDLLLHLPYPKTVRLEVIKKLPMVTVSWNGDDEWFWNKYPELSETIEDSHNYCITTHEKSLFRYRHGILGSWGYSDEWKPQKVKKDIDIYFCGSKTNIRDMYIQTLIDRGFDVVVDGPGYSGKIPLKTMIERYARAKIGLSFVTETKDKLVYQQVKARSFEIPAVGTFQLSENTSDLHSFFKQKRDMDLFLDPASLVRACKYYLTHDKERETIALSGHFKNKEYSYKKIFKRVLKQIKQSESDNKIKETYVDF